MAAGGLIATNATLLANAQWIIATTSTGRREVAKVVAVDPASDVGTGAHRHDAARGAFRRLERCATGHRRRGDGVLVGVGRRGDDGLVERHDRVDRRRSGIGAGHRHGQRGGDRADGDNPDGAVLMEPDGVVLGILDKSGVPAAGNGSVFLPGEFVMQVAQELMSDGGHSARVARVPRCQPEPHTTRGGARRRGGRVPVPPTTTWSVAM